MNDFITENYLFLTIAQKSATPAFALRLYIVEGILKSTDT